MWIHRPKKNLSFAFLPLGLTEGVSLTGCAAQKEPQKWGHEGIPGQPDSIDWTKQSQEAGETNHQCMEEQHGGAVAAEDKNGGIMTDEVPGQWCKAESNCRYTCLQDMTLPEVRSNEFIHCSPDACLLYFYFILAVS